MNAKLSTMIDQILNKHEGLTDSNGNALFKGDCLEIMPLIPDKSIDMILADLPYGITACKWDSVIDLPSLWAQYKRIIKDNGAIVLTASQPFTSALVMSNVEMFKYEWIWNKISHSNLFVAKYRCLPVHENILIFAKGKTVYNPQMVKNNFILTGDLKNGKHLGELFINKDKGSKRNSSELSNPKSIIEIKKTGSFGNGSYKNDHPTQKPLELMKYLIKTYTNEGFMVLDNTMGSGTTCLAAKELNRKYIGIEKEQKYFEIACKRLNPLDENFL